MEAALFLINEPPRIRIWVPVGIEADKLATQQELSLDFVLRHGALESSANKFPVVSFSLVASFEGL
jgi:hypothetical protein